VVRAAAQSAGVGDVSFLNTGSAAAQAPFLLGLAQLHNFEYEDAARAFQDAQRIDPEFVMAYWGEAMTRNHPVWMEQDLAGARRILGRLAPTSAKRLAKPATERERAYLQAVETLFGGGDKFERDRRYLEAMRQIHVRYPDDVDAAAFYALAQLGSAHDGRDDSIYMAAAATLEQAFASHPNHPGVAHYLIHSYDDPVHAVRGLPAARRYSAIAPAAPHALHMTSHIYLAAGMWDDVVAANERATTVAADRARAAGRSAPGCGHSNMWLLYGYLQQGRGSAARTILDRCRAAATSAGGLAARSPEQDPLDPDNIPAGSYIQMWSRYVIDTASYDDSIAREDIPLGSLAGAQLTRAFVRALAAAQARDLARLTAAADDVQSARRILETTLNNRSDADQYRRRAAILDREIQALTLVVRDRTQDALDLLHTAAADEQAMPVAFGPPFVDKPASELLGDVLLALDRPADAITAYEAALARAPKRTASLLGLARAAAKAGSPKAANAYADLRQVWHAAERIPDDVKAR